MKSEARGLGSTLEERPPGREWLTSVDNLIFITSSLPRYLMAYATLPVLPFELWGCISSYLSNSDIKNLRLSCVQFRNASILRIDRVFLSANPLNVQVFRCIAGHDKFRHGVTEIVWDEARFARGPHGFNESAEGNENFSDEDEPGNTREWAQRYGSYPQERILERHEFEDGCPKWFKHACEANLALLTQRRGRDVDRPDHIERREQVFAQPALSERWKYYRHLLDQQKDVLANNSDVHALLYGVKQFPALKRVTITPSAHGHLFTPLYSTPMIRAFPKGFNYPIPRGWLNGPVEPPIAYHWKEYPELRERYRGVISVLRVLANEPNSVSELVMSSNHLPTGLNCTIFDQPCEEYDNFAIVLKNPGFRHLAITFLIGGESDDQLDACWRSFLNGRLRSTLDEAKDMEDFSLHTTVINNPYDDEYSAGSPERLIPLQSFIPVDKWPKLCCFELSRFLVTQPDVISFLCALPKSIRFIKLSMLKFLDEGGDWHGLLQEMRTKIRGNTLWADRDARSQPAVLIGLKLPNPQIGRMVWLEKEVQEYLYGEGQNPFFERTPLDIPWGIGIQRDAFEPSFERPNISGVELRNMEIYDKNWEYNASDPKY
ncbi:hypothetical protein N7516_008327 [Penicillium verrucosum]|uniref:uncharacterized protein n=1 Tax=Penicillium verrucosum TaxID=60171 RepID=UPI0025451311|nr:uncharacterized protein N7516_008327 [Penicillium verrucosum]KAJ5926554.1 hypothetical protein N7516_008327 [Penicillium verrucosum]